MQRLKGAFRFIDQNFRLAQSHEAIQNPWMVLSLGFILLSILWLVPLGGLLIGLGSTPFVWAVIGAIFLFYLLSLLVLGELTALRTAQIFANLIQRGQTGTFDQSSMAVLRNAWKDILIYVLSLPAINLIVGFRALSSSPAQTNQAWLKAYPLIPPIIALDGLKLPEAIARLKDIFAKKYLRFQPEYLPVGGVARFVQWASVLVGAAAGLFVGLRLPDLLPASSWRVFWAAGAGLLVAGTFSTAGIAFSTYFRTCYHTALYVWALDVQSALNGTGDESVSPPEILSQAFQRKANKEKEGRDETET